MGFVSLYVYKITVGVISMRFFQDMDFKQMLTVDRLLFFCLFLTFFTMPSGISPPTIFISAALLIWLFSGRCVRFCRGALKRSWTWPVLFLIALTWIGLLYSPDVSNYGLKYAKKTHYYLYGLVVASFVFKKFPVEKLLRAFLWGLAVNAIVGVFQAMGLVPPVENQFTGFGMGYRTLSAYLTIGILYSAYHFGNSPGEKKTKAVYAGFMVLFFCHLTLLMSRTGYYTFILLAPLILHFAFRKIGALKNLGICLIVVCAMFLSPVVRERVVLTKQQLQYHMEVDQSQAWGKVYTPHQDRFYMWYGAARIILDNPVFGVGTGGYSVELKKIGDPKGPEINHPHNDMIYMTVSFGIVGLLTYFWFFTEIIKNSWPHRYMATGNFILSSALVIIISGLTNAQILDAGMILLLSLIVGLQNNLPQFLEGHNRKLI
jgi:O-antigen ligase